MKELKILAMIPARMGSTRLRQKNLALLNNRPMISYAIQAAKESGVFDKIFINSENSIFSDIAIRYGIDFYQRPNPLGSSETKSDEVINDFFLKNECDILVWVNPVSPLQTAKEIFEAVNYFEKNQLDSLITVLENKVHGICNHLPINFISEKPFAQTQDLSPILTFAYSQMMWKRKSYLENYKQKGFALMSGKFGTFPVSRSSAISIKTADDFLFAEEILKSRINKKQSKIQYDMLIK